MADRERCDWGILPDVPKDGCLGVVEVVSRHYLSDIVHWTCLPCAGEIVRQNREWIVENVPA